MIATRLRFVLGGLLCAGLCMPRLSFTEWRPLGPFGGDVRSLIQDPNQPHRLYLGTADSQIFVSETAGASWQRLSAVASRADLVVDHILITPQNSNVLYVGVWSIANLQEGGVFKSTDAGRTWMELPGLRGQSVRTLVMARYNPNVIFAGTLKGVFRTEDAGATWVLISPPGHAEIQNIESIAVDPRDSQVIYVGTWHLPWKTTDGGQNWFPIRRGIVDDSDVFSIHLSSSNPANIFLSACTGIYQSQNGGGLWTKFQGIPYTSRRTRVILPDPSNNHIIYAGTTEGLWRSENAGASWRRITTPALTVNSIVIDSQDSSRVYLGTEDAGVLLSTDRGQTFAASNYGFANRAISAALLDRQVESRIWVSVLYDNQHGGVFRSEDGGSTWRQVNQGLPSTDVHTLFQSTIDGSVWAGTADGVFRLDPAQNQWVQGDPRIIDEVQVSSAVSGGTRNEVRSQPVSIPRKIARRNLGAVIAFSGEPIRGHAFFAATTRGLFLTSDGGRQWKQVRVSPLDAPGRAVLVISETRVFYGTSQRLWLTDDGGSHWESAAWDGDSPINGIYSLPGHRDTIFLATQNGLFRSTDGGKTWAQRGGGLPLSDIVAVHFDPSRGENIFASESYQGATYRSSDQGESWKRLETSLSPGLKIQTFFLDATYPDRAYALLFREGLYLFRAAQEEGATSGRSKSFPWSDHAAIR